MNSLRRVYRALVAGWKAMSPPARWILILLIGVALVFVFAPQGPEHLPASPPITPETGEHVIDWWPVLLAFAVEVMSKASFWICVCLLWAASIIGSAIGSAAETINDQLEELLDQLKEKNT